MSDDKQKAISEAWANLYDMNDYVWSAAAIIQRDAAVERGKREEAMQKLRDLGVDVDGLLRKAQKRKQPWFKKAGET